MKLNTTLRVLIFWLLCAIWLAVFSGLFKDLHFKWSQQVMLIATILLTVALIPVFVKWEGLQLTDVGIIPNKHSIKKVTIGFLLGLLMTLFQPAFVYLFGHYKIEFSDSFQFSIALNFLTLYILVAIREELAFRTYPLFSLNKRFGLWPAQIIIIIIFSIEHIIGGMTWWQSFFGAGTGALLFGLAAIRTNGIAFPTGLHFAWNFGQWIVGFKKETGLLYGVAEKGFENLVERNAWIAYFIIMAISISLIFFYKPKYAE